MTTRHVILTREALTNALAGEPTCDTCAGRGRILGRRRRDDHVCPACGGKGVPKDTLIQTRGWAYPMPDVRGW